MSTAAVASAASGIARRSRVRGLDGLARRRSFHGTPPVSPPGTRARAGSAAAALAPNRSLVRCKSLTSATSITGGGGGGGGGRRSYTSAARVTSAARRGGDWSDDKFVGADGINFGGQFLAGAMAVAGALVATSSGGEEDLGNDRVGGDTTNWGNDRAGGGGRGGGRGGGVWCDASVAAASRNQHVASPGSCSFRKACCTDSQNNKSSGMLSRSSSSSSSSSSCGSEVIQVSARALSCLEPSAAVPAAPAARSPAPSITDVYCFKGAAEPVIGRGQRSVVTTARHRLTGQPVAVKRLARAETTRLEVMEEVQMLKVAGKHPNVVTMQAFFEDQEAYYIVMEMCEGGELFHRLADK
ncbi:unnamed protein product, partial [Ectocarpus sp. 12 AP-2014]